MKKFLLAILFLFSTVSYALTPAGNVNSEGFGGTDGAECLRLAEGNSQGYFTLESAAATGTDLYNLYKSGTKYSPTGGKTAKCRCLCHTSATADFQNLALFTSTTTFADGIGAGSLTGTQKWEFGASAVYGHGGQATNTQYCEKITYEMDNTGSTLNAIGVMVKNSNYISMVCKEI